MPQGGEPRFSPLGRCRRIYFACSETNWEIPRPLLAAGYFIFNFFTSKITAKIGLARCDKEWRQSDLYLKSATSVVAQRELLCFLYLTSDA
jgi:hypothetical protein